MSSTAALPIGEMASRLGEWQSALADVTARTSLEDGLRLELGPHADLAEITRLVRAELECCPFFSFAISFDTGRTTLDVRAPKDVAPLLEGVFTTAS